MIIKGGSRAAPSHLAWHLQRRDTNGTVRILELQSPVENLKEAFRDWQFLTEGTRGEKGLYHANIDPAKDYVMTPEQWRRAVEVLEQELGFQGQPRAVVMHEKEGRQHIHVVWARTDIDTMTLRSDSQNYLAHERASQRLELEFGHEPVPGKHAKRDREKQPEFPNAEANHAEWQQGERTGIDPSTRKDQVTALKQACDNGQTFKAALEEQGYVLARGDRRDFVIVDETGSIHSLGRQVRDMKAADLRAFMKDVDRTALPSTEEAVALQRQRSEERRKDQPAQEKAGEQGPEPQKEKPKRRKKKTEAKAHEANGQDHPPKEQEARPDEQQPQPAEQAKPQEPEVQPQETREQQRDQQDATPEHVAQEEPRQQEAASDQIPEQESRQEPQTQAAEQPEAQTALTPEDADKWAAYHAFQLERHAYRLERMDFVLGALLDLDQKKEFDAYVAGQRQEMEALKNRLRAETFGINGYIQARESRLNPTLGAERAAERRREIAMMNRRLDQEQKDYTALLDQSRQLRLEDLKQQPVQQLLAAVEKVTAEANEDLARYLREAERYRAIVADFAEAERERQQEKGREQAEAPKEPQEQAPAQTQAENTTAQEPTPEALQAETEALRKALAERAAEERQRLIEKQTAELNQLRETLARDSQEKLDRFNASFRYETEALLRRHEQARTGFSGFVESVRNFLSPGRAAAQEAERQRERQELERRQKQQRDEYLALLQRTNERQIKEMQERHAVRLQQLDARADKDLDRYLREHEAARKLEAEIEEREKHRAEELGEEGPERPPPKFTK